MLSVISILTSPAKLSIVEFLNTPKTPDDIASKLGITRQGVDKQLRELQSYGIVEKRWFIGYNRPRVEFHMTDIGVNFYKNLDDFITRFRNEGKVSLEEKLRILDIDLLEGSISPTKYREEKEEIEKSMKWFAEEK